MPAILAIVVALGARLIVHGTLRMDGLKLRGGTWMIVAFLMTAVLPALAPKTDSGFALFRLLWLAIMLFLLVMCLVNSMQAPGFFLLSIGIAMNLLVVASNGGMPVNASAISAVADPARSAARLATDFFHVSGVHAVFPVLADAIPVPGPSFVRSVVSPGDVAMLIGVVVVLTSASPSRALPRSDRETSGA
jgi:hypothetical protein